MSKSRKVVSVELNFPVVDSDADSDASEAGDRLSNSFSSFTYQGIKKRPGQRKLGETTIHQCARNNDLEGLKRLLKNKDVLQHVNALDENGMSALHYAARFNHAQTVKFLVEDGKAGPMVEDTDRATPLHYVARKKQQEESKDTIEIIQFLSRIVDINTKDRYQSTPLHFAAIRGNLVATRTLLKCREVLVNAKDALGCTPLHNAATYGNADVAELLICNGARLLHTDNDKCTALHLASVEGKDDIVKLLLDKCDENHKTQLVRLKDDEETSALQYAVESRSTECVKILIENGAQVNAACRVKTSGVTPLHLAAIEDVPEIGKLLLTHGADIAARDNNFATPLHKAAEYMCPKMTKVLLANVKISVDLRDNDFYTPLLCAVCYSNPEVVQMLIDENADLNLTQNSERNVIHMATECQQEEVLKILLATVKKEGYGHLINAEDRYGDTPLHIAAEINNVNIVKMLLENGANLFSKNEDEVTPMLIACENGNYRVVEEMLKRNEKVLNDEDECSNNALHLASRNGHMEVVQLLCESGAEKNDKNTTYQCPIDLAAETGQEDIVKYLLEQDVMPDPIDKERESPLQLASLNGHDKVVEILIRKGADVTRLNRDNKNCLMIAIDKGHRGVVSAILNSSKWQEALAEERIYDNGNLRDTPLRQLIKKMPDMVTEALDHFVTKGPDDDAKKMHDTDFYIQFHLELLDDTYLDDYQRRSNIFRDVKGELKDEYNLPDKELKPYSSDLNWVKYNHPLMLMVQKKHTNMLDHPAVLALIKHKWDIGRKFYFMFLLYYALFVGFYTAFMVEADPPYLFSNCSEYEAHSFEEVGKICIYVFAGVGLIIEVFQFFATWLLYFSEPINFLDIFCYVSSILTVTDYSCNGMREDWQWALGSFTMLAIWLNFLLFFRRFPALGIYVVMVTDILRTFMKLIVIFLLFIVAFGLSFYMLLQNQEVFNRPERSILKTFVMMLGELEYTSAFFPDDESENPPYFGVTVTIFIFFLIIMAVILMNLLVGLAVEDVNELRQHAMLVRLRMQIDLALDVEMAMPRWLQRFFLCNKKHARIYPNVYEGFFSKLSKNINKFIEGPLLADDNILDAVKCLDDEDLPTLSFVQERLSARLSRNDATLKEINDRLGRIEKFLTQASQRMQATPRPLPPPRRQTSEFDV